MSVYYWSCAALSDIGTKRKRNEDNFYLDGQWLPLGGGNSPELRRGGRLRRSGILAVFDGMGGEAAGDRASHAAAELLHGCRSALFRSRDLNGMRRNTERFVQQVNQALLRLREECKAAVGSTMALLLLRQGVAYAANLGDSRIYLLRQGRLLRLSRDHTVAQALRQQGELSREQAETDPRRNLLLRHLGSQEGGSSLMPSFFQLPLEMGDRFLLCSDGVSAALPEQELQRLLQSAGSAGAAAKKLVQAALAAGSRDNATAVCAFVSVGLF